jgi:hypothetical protein
LQLFFDNRSALARGLDLVRAGQVFQAELVMRPRERKRLAVAVDIVLNAVGAETCLEWRIAARDPGETRPAA